MGAGMGVVRTTAYCLKLRRHDKLSPERIEAIQTENLRQAVRYAKAHSPFYRDLYGAVDPEAPDFSVRSLPLTNKDMLMENFDRVVTDPQLSMEKVKVWAQNRDNLGQWFLDKYVVAHTSGTTGMPASMHFMAGS